MPSSERESARSWRLKAARLRAMRHERAIPWWGWFILLTLLPLVLPLVALVLALNLLAALLLQVVVWLAWCSRGRCVLFVYSDSPLWRGYLEEHVLPQLGTRAVVLNWSDRQRWRLTLAVLLFRFFGGAYEFNPMAIVFQPFKWRRCFRFYRAFRDFKHRRPHTVESIRRELLQLVDAISPPTRAA